MISKLGIYTLLAGLFLGLFAGISTFMSADNIWVGLTLSKIIGEDRAESMITFFDSVSIQNALDIFFYSIPAFVLVLSLAVILLVISLFVREH